MERVTGRASFEAFGKSERRGRRGPLSVIYVPVPSDGPESIRAAYAIGRRVGNAVVRNRIKRRLRAIVASQAPNLLPGSYLIRVSLGAQPMSFDELSEMMRQTFERAGTWRSGMTG